MSMPTPVKWPLSYYNGPLRRDGVQAYYGADYDGDGFVDLGEELDGTDSPELDGTFCCTSAAAPMLAGTTALLRDHHHAMDLTSLDDPALLYATLLMMGDGTQRSSSNPSEIATTPRRSGFDPIWGAGRLRLRMLDAWGMDGPWNVKWGSFCIVQGTKLLFAVSQDAVTGTINPISADVDIMKVVSWHYDPNHDSGGGLSDIDLAVFRGTGSLATVVGSDLSADHKKRVVLTDAALGTTAQPFFLEFTANTVRPGTFGGCPANQARVYFALMYEDSDREAGEVPECVGVEP
jgi:hypothetical protein